ncbi:hypothetical protein EVAR_46643_1 [Eumeta japonica]|uniref:Uncharacterized protein n=1 Tax=Eumeta variegata TaxID=151549 RepID=A0A4C1WFU3_EUMVA|nr:hypothetical protein EVAR_46643_1 [Eumeta japonica]
MSFVRSGGARRRRRRRPPTASRLKGPRKQKSFAYKLLKRGLAKSFAYKLLKRGLANLMSPTSTSGVAPPLFMDVGAGTGEARADTGAGVEHARYARRGRVKQRAAAAVIKSLSESSDGPLPSITPHQPLLSSSTHSFLHLIVKLYFYLRSATESTSVTLSKSRMSMGSGDHL